jgi:protoheme IX farnesyltransferase
VLPISLCPFLFQLAGPVYLAAAFLLGGGYLVCAIQFARRLDLPSARRLFFASIIYLPLLLIALVADKIK